MGRDVMGLADRNGKVTYLERLWVGMIDAEVVVS